MGRQTEPTAFDGRSDYDAFVAAGIPAGGPFTGAEDIMTPEQASKWNGDAGVAFDRCYHQACDTIANVDLLALGEMADASGARHPDVRHDDLGGAWHRQGERQGDEVRPDVQGLSSRQVVVRVWGGDGRPTPAHGAFA